MLGIDAIVQAHPTTILIAAWAVLAAQLAAGLALRRRRARVGRSAYDAPPPVDAYELAALTGGSLSVVTVAAAQLHVRGHVGLSRASGEVVALFAPGAAAAEIERELYDAIARSPGLNAHKLPKALTRGPAYAGLQRALAAKGLLPPPGIATPLRVVSSTVWPWVCLLVLWVLPPLEDTTAIVAAIALPMASATILYVLRRGPAMTGLGSSIVARERGRHAGLREGPVDDRELAPAVALFGSEPLRLSHPSFARAWGIVSPEEQALQAALM